MADLTRIALGLVAASLTMLGFSCGATESTSTTHIRPTSANLNGDTFIAMSVNPTDTWYELARSPSALDEGPRIECLRRFPGSGNLLRGVPGARRFDPCTVTGLVPATTYYWRECRGSKARRGGCRSKVKTFTTPRASSPPCDLTIRERESVREFLDRLDAGGTGCLTAGTYTVGNLDNFRPGQELTPSTDDQGRRDRVVLRGTLRLDEPGIELHDLFLVGVFNSRNDKVISVNRCDFCVIDHLDITTSPEYEDFQGILNNTPSRGLRITNNRIHHIGNEGGHDHGIYCKAPMARGVIEGNWLYRNAAYGIIFYTNCDGVDFRYNVVANNGVFEDCNPDQPPGSRCPATRQNGRGIAISGQPDLGLGETDSALVRNSIITSSARFGENGLLHCYRPGSGNAVRDVLLDWSWSGRFPSGSDCPDHVPVRKVSRKVEPGFVDEARDDYRLRTDSPARAILGGFADREPGPRL